MATAETIPSVDLIELLSDPLNFQKMCWPEVTLYDKQVEILHSLRDNDETIVPAGNQLGKDFIAGFAALWFFVSRSPCRVITSSAGQAQLKSVLWGEIRRFLNTCKYPLPIQVNDLLLRQVIDGQLEPRSYCQGIVTNEAENLLGHHLERGADSKPRTLAIFDEASSINDEFYDAVDTWAHRKLIIGNPLPCTNVFFNSVRAGDIARPDGDGYFRKIIKIKAQDSPNVRLAEKQIANGEEPTLEQLLPGVVDYHTYLKRRQLWDKVRQCIGLDAEFYLGAEVLLFPPEWLNRCESFALTLEGKRRTATHMGIDPAEGGDNTVWTIIDEMGIIDQISMKTEDTAEITSRTLGLMRQYKMEPRNILFDRGGGGKQHADRLRQQGHDVRTVGFGEAPSDVSMWRYKTVRKKFDESEHKYVYKNRRAEMYGMLRFAIDPLNGDFAIPGHLSELRRQLSLIPLLYDPEGRLFLPPKDKVNPNQQIETLKHVMGCSPDEADSLVLAIFGQLGVPKRKKLRAF